MKIKIISSLILSIIFHNAFADNATIKGVNYDPVHSLDFAKAVGLDNKQGMIDAINNDLDKLIELQSNGFNNIRFIKTFFSNFSSLGSNPSKRVEVNIADVVNDWNTKHPNNAVKLALGVYEFRVNTDGCQNENECKKWTQEQVNVAIASAKKYPQLIDKIIVGNEDLGDESVKNHIVEDMTTIREKINNKSIKIGTAQLAGDISDMFNHGKFADVKQAADFVGTNVYPYWGGVVYSDAKNNLEGYWKDINSKRGEYEVIETEEGWPTNGNPVGQAIPSPDSALDYLKYWYNRDGKTASTSYLFALFDKTPGQGTESHWGIYNADRNASLLGSPNDKPLAKGHVMVKFTNLIGQGGGTARIAALNACTGDWNSGSKTQTGCYPIDGYYHTGDIAKSNSRQFMIDATGQTYSSLLVVFYGDGRDAPRLCYINKDALLKLNNQSQVMLQWKTPDGAVPCEVR